MKVYAAYISMLLCFAVALSWVDPAFAEKPTIPALAAGKQPPRLMLLSRSTGNQWTAHRNQSIEMSKDFAKTCPDVQITLNKQMADYTIVLNHIEVGFSRNNQMQIAAKNGDQLAIAEGGSIKARVTSACLLILNDWNRKNPE